MITAGTIVNTSHYQVQIDTELTNRDTSPNTNPKLSYEITISLFDYGGDQRTHTILASSASSPGLCGGYAVGDVVIVGFFQNDFDQAVILGKVDYDKADIAAACAVKADAILANTVTVSSKVTTKAFEAQEATLTRLTVPGKDGTGHSAPVTLQQSDFQNLLYLLGHREAIEQLIQDATS